MKHLLSNLRLNRHFLYCLLTAGFLCLNGCGYVIGYDVEQVIEPSIINTTEMELKTRVWANGKIIGSWYDNMDKVDSSFVRYRQAQGDSLIAAAKACR
jgi:hypothetical protein